MADIISPRLARKNYLRFIVILHILKVYKYRIYIVILNLFCLGFWMRHLTENQK